jgi:pantothenate synthetase
MHQVMRAHHVEPDYAVIRHPQTLAELDSIEPKLTGGVVALVAGRLGPVRLIDNMVLAANA